ncbi:MAG TPA: POTRA domain-containing protein [Candidatus Udaeobacter sp.]|nr:POTRA domain-containing protein [Candidatus Udaeobacter sp.]
MLRRNVTLSSFTCLLLCPLLLPQCAKDNRSSKSGGILIKDFTIVGTQALSSTELARITGELTGYCFNDDSEEMGERIRAVFQNRGYFAAEVKSVHFKSTDPLGVPKPVVMEAEVSEGLRYKLAEITFVENHAISAGKLRDAFPLKPGDLFERDKIARGLESVRKLYGTDGYLDSVMIPATAFGSNGTVSLKITVDEGPQYHMGKLEILAGAEMAARLLSKWKLAEGEVYDVSYIDQYIKANRDLLPANFTTRDVVAAYDCPNALVQLRMVVDPEFDASKSAPKSVPCEGQDSKK